MFDVRDDVESLLGGEVLVRFASSTVGSAQACLLRRLSGATVQGEDQCAFGSTLVRFGPMEELFKEAQEQGVEVGLSEEEELDAIPTRVNLVPRVSSARFSGPAQPDVQALEGAGGRVRVVAEERLRIDFDLVDVDEALWRFQGGRFVDDGDEHELAVFIYGDPAEVESEEAAVSIVMHPKSELVLVAVVRDGAGNASSMWFEVEAG